MNRLNFYLGLTLCLVLSVGAFWVSNAKHWNYFACIAPVWVLSAAWGAYSQSKGWGPFK